MAIHRNTMSQDSTDSSLLQKQELLFLQARPMLTFVIDNTFDLCSIKNVLFKGFP